MSSEIDDGIGYESVERVTPLTTAEIAALDEVAGTYAGTNPRPLMPHGDIRRIALTLRTFERRIAELEAAREGDAFWKEGVWSSVPPTVDQVREELADYAGLLDRVREVYCHVTGGRLSKANHRADVICGEADAYYGRQSDGNALDLLRRSLAPVIFDLEQRIVQGKQRLRPDMAEPLPTPEDAAAIEAGVALATDIHKRLNETIVDAEREAVRRAR